VIRAPADVRLTFLGTGAAGGTPGDGRSARRESSLLVEAGAGVLIDATTHAEPQLADVDRLDAVLLTHAHRDAAGGVPALRRWSRERDLAPLPLYAAPQAIAVLQSRYRRLDHLELVAVEPGRRRERSGLAFEPVEVPHARDRYRTFAWRVEDARCAVVYASDVARLEPTLERFVRGARLLAVDGAMWQRSLFSHLTIDRELPALCRWPVERILLTQIGRSAPSHEALERAVRTLCPKARPAWDGLTVELE
jgi:phosphoribosyl 1,2-cyclic phosphodiesterase